MTAEVGDTFCSSQTLTTADGGTIDIVVAQAEGDRWDVVVYDADAETETVITVGRGSASFAGVAGEEYLVIVKPFFVTPGNGFTATATLTLPIAEEPPVVEPPAEAPAA